MMLTTVASGPGYSAKRKAAMTLQPDEVPEEGSSPRDAPWQRRGLRIPVVTHLYAISMLFDAALRYPLGVRMASQQAERKRSRLAHVRRLGGALCGSPVLRRSNPVRVIESSCTTCIRGWRREFRRVVECGRLARQLLGWFHFICEQPQFQRFRRACCQHGCDGIEGECEDAAIRQTATCQGKRGTGKERCSLVPAASIQKARAGWNCWNHGSQTMPEEALRGLSAGRIAQRHGRMRGREQRVRGRAILERLCLQLAILG